MAKQLDPVLVEWGGRLKVIREARGLSIQQAAAINKMSDSCWEYWEAGASKPQGRLLRPLMANWSEVRAPGDKSPPKRPMTSLSDL